MAAVHLGNLRGPTGDRGDRGATGLTGDRGATGVTPGSEQGYLRRVLSSSATHPVGNTQVALNSSGESSNATQCFTWSNDGSITSTHGGLAIISGAMMATGIRRRWLSFRINGVMPGDEFITGDGFVERTGTRTHLHLVSVVELSPGDTVTMWIEPIDSITSNTLYTYLSVAMI